MNAVRAVSQKYQRLMFPSNFRADGKRRKNDRQESSRRRSSGERDTSRYDNGDESTRSSEQQHDEQRRSTLGSSSNFARVDWQPFTRSDSIPQTYLFSVPPRMSSFSRHTESTFASINASHWQSPTLVGQCRPNDNEHAFQPYLPRDHPMAVSTRIAYGFTPGLNGKPTTSPPDMSGPTQQAYTDSTLLSASRHPDSTAFSDCVGLPIAASTSKVPSSFARGLPSRQLPPPVRSWLASPRTGMMPLSYSASSERIFFESLRSDLATILRSCGHLTSQELKLPPLREVPRTENIFKETEPY